MTLEAHSNSTSAAGSANAAELRVDYSTVLVQVDYDVSAAGSIEIETTNDGSTWDSYHSESVGSGGNADALIVHTSKAGVRAYASSMADADVTDITVSARGDG